MALILEPRPGSAAARADCLGLFFFHHFLFSIMIPHRYQSVLRTTTMTSTHLTRISLPCLFAREASGAVVMSCTPRVAVSFARTRRRGARWSARRCQSRAELDGPLCNVTCEPSLVTQAPSKGISISKALWTRLPTSKRGKRSATSSTHYSLHHPSNGCISASPATSPQLRKRLVDCT
jgi:hypothetical protein